MSLILYLGTQRVGLKFLLTENVASVDIYSDAGSALKDEIINLTPTMPPMNTKQFSWSCIGDSNAETIIFTLLQETNKTVKLAEHIICNTSYELESGALSAFPQILPIGPLLASNRLGKSAGYFWPEDSSCLSWLDQQVAQSVVYVAFGSFTIFDPKQIQELAQGLELINRPFLWVIRPDMTNEDSKVYLEGYKERIGNRGRMVSWTPQQKVLSHPSVACFVSHSGWNSTMEGMSNGLPFLCWPYFADQFLNQTYIVDVWKVGLGLNRDENGIVTKEELKNKVEEVLHDKTLKERALVLMERVVMSVQKGGGSYKNMTDFIEWMEK